MSLRALLAEALLQQGTRERAAAVLLPVRSLLGVEPGGMAALAMLLARTGAHNEALTFKTYGRTEKWFLVEYAAAVAQIEEFTVAEHAAEILAEQLELFPDPSEGIAFLEAMADVLNSIGEKDKAIALLEGDHHFGPDHELAIARLDPTSERIAAVRDHPDQLAVAVLMVRAGRDEEAFELVKEFVPSSPDVGIGLERAGEKVAAWAMALYESLPATDPLAEALAEPLVTALLNAGQPRDAWRLCESRNDLDLLLYTYLQMPPGSLPPMRPPVEHPALVLAWCRGLIRQGHGKEAVGIIFRAITGDENLDDALLVNAAEMFIELGKLDAAEQLGKQCKDDVAKAVITGRLIRANAVRADTSG